MRQILCVEDAESERLLLRAGLAGYLVSFSASVKEAIQLLQKNTYSLLILDLNLPDGSGIDVLSAARTQDKYVETPILILSGNKEFQLKAAAFALGADDFLEKPFDPREVKVRVDAKFRRIDQLSQNGEILRLGGLIFDVHGQTLKREADAAPIFLTSLEFRILYILAKAPGRVFSRDSLIETAWGGNIAVEVRTVDSHIANLRKKIAGPKLSIVTVIGTGYKLNAGDADEVH